MLDMANDSGLFRPSAANGETLQGMLDAGWKLEGNVLTKDGERLVPLYEAKMLHHFDHRYGTYEGQTQAQANVGTLPRPNPNQKDNPSYTNVPGYWVSSRLVNSRLAARFWERKWLLGWRNIARSTDVRTLICSLLPISGVAHSFPLLLPQAPQGALLYANLASAVLDFVGRQKMAGTNYTQNYFKQLPVIQPEDYQEACAWNPNVRLDCWVRTRVLELAYTSYDMEPFARDHGDNGPPYRWDEERRFWLRAELDAAYFHLYGVARDDVDYIMDTFQAFKNTKPDEFARTTTAIGEIYAAMADAIAGRGPYQTVLTPPPGHGPRHPARSDS